MKKYITIAALLVAGTSFSNATTLEDGTIIQSGHTTEDGSFAVTLKLDVDTLRTYLEEGATPVKHTLVSYYAGTTLTGVTTNFSSSNNKIYDSGLYYIWGDKYAWGELTHSDNTISGTTNDLSDLSWDNIGYAGLTYSFGSTDGTRTSLSLLDKTGVIVYQSYNYSSGLKSNQASSNTLTFDDAVIGAIYYTSILEESDVKSLASAVAQSNIPEPSAFGLLAGIGALALVASRRRRK